MNLDIEKTLVVSTGNISKNTVDLLEAGKLKSLIVDSYVYGWRINTNLIDYDCCFGNGNESRNGFGYGNRDGNGDGNGDGDGNGRNLEDLKAFKDEY